MEFRNECHIVRIIQKISILMSKMLDLDFFMSRLNQYLKNSSNQPIELVWSETKDESGSTMTGFMSIFGLIEPNNFLKKGWIVW